MGVEDKIIDNLNGDFSNVDKMLSSFDTNNELLDKMIENELYNQELYNGGEGSRYNQEGDTVKDVLFDIVDKTTNFDISNIDKLEELDISNISASYNKTADMYRNQNAVDYYAGIKKKKFQNRNKHLLEDVDNRIRQKDVYKRQP